MWNGWNYVRGKVRIFKCSTFHILKSNGMFIESHYRLEQFLLFWPEKSIGINVEFIHSFQSDLDVGTKLGGGFVRGDNVRSGFSEILLVTSQSKGSCIEIG